MIAGGAEMSTYPDRCVATFERRTVPGEDGASVVREFEALAEGAANAAVKLMLERPPSEMSPEHELSRAVAEAAGGPAVIGVPYWMDMALMNAAGIPTVCFGPSGEGEHADVEWVDLASVERCVEVYTAVARRLCG